jgi:predicted component of type VI protein secretion system
MPRLVVESSEIEQQTFELTGPVITIGRAPGNVIQIPHASVSSQHAELRLQDGDYKITDLNSTNGSRINDERITEAVLRNNDILQLGNLIFRYQSEHILEAPPLPAVEETLVVASQPSPKPDSFRNIGPFPKAKAVSSASAFPVPVLAAVLVALAALGFFVYRLFTV